MFEPDLRSTTLQLYKAHRGSCVTWQGSFAKCVRMENKHNKSFCRYISAHVIEEFLFSGFRNLFHSLSNAHAAFCLFFLVNLWLNKSTFHLNAILFVFNHSCLYYCHRLWIKNNCFITSFCIFTVLLPRLNPLAGWQNGTSSSSSSPSSSQLHQEMYIKTISPRY